MIWALWAWTLRNPTLVDRGSVGCSRTFRLYSGDRLEARTHYACRAGSAWKLQAITLVERWALWGSILTLIELSAVTRRESELIEAKWTDINWYDELTWFDCFVGFNLIILKLIRLIERNWFSPINGINASTGICDSIAVTCS